MNFQRVFQLGLRRVGAPGLRVQLTGYLVQRRYVIAAQLKLSLILIIPFANKDQVDSYHKTKRPE